MRRKTDFIQKIQGGCRIFPVDRHPRSFDPLPDEFCFNHRTFTESLGIHLPRFFSLFTDRGPAAVKLSDVLPVGRYLLMLMALWGLLDAVNLIISGALKGAGDTRFVMYYSVLMNWCGWLAGECVIIFVFHGGLIAAWIWLAIYVMLTSIGFLWRFRGGRWKTIDLLEREIPLEPRGSGAEALPLAE